MATTTTTTAATSAGETVTTTTTTAANDVVTVVDNASKTETPKQITAVPPVWEYANLDKVDQDKIRDCQKVLKAWKQDWVDEQKARDWRLEGPGPKEWVKVFDDWEDKSTDKHFVKPGADGKVNDDTCKIFLNGIRFKINKYITKLDFDNNDITDVGAKAIANVLKNKDIATFKRLYLCNNSFGDAGATAIAEALKDNDKLKLLHIKQNKLTKYTAEAFQELVKVSTTLEVLDLSRNEIGNEGAEGFIDALKPNSTLIILEMSFMNLKRAVKKKLKRLVGKDEFNRDLKVSDEVDGWKEAERHTSLGWMRIREEDDLKHYRH